MKSFFRRHNHLANDGEVIAIIRRLDLDADAKLCKAEFLEGIRPEEPYSKMIVREQLDRTNNMKRAEKEAKKKHKKVKEQDIPGSNNAIRVQALDRSYKDQLSSSPLKYRTPKKDSQLVCSISPQKRT